MVNQKLMCMWQAVSTMQGDAKSTVPKHLVKRLTSGLANMSCAKWSEQEFDVSFPSETITFGEFSLYVINKLRNPDSAIFILEQEIENICWKRIIDLLDTAGFPWAKEKSVRNLWRIFNRLSQPGSMPPVMSADDIFWLAERLAAHVDNAMVTASFKDDLSFPDVLKILHENLFNKTNAESAEKAVSEIHSWLVREVVLAGWLWKRSKKHANWTAWLKRWFVLTPGMLTYFDGPRLKTKKGEVIINKDTVIADSVDLKRMGRRMTSCFSVINRQVIQLDFASFDDGDKATWMSSLLEVKQCTINDTTPIQIILNERRQKKMPMKEATKSIKKRTLTIKATKIESPEMDRKSAQNVKRRINVKEPNAKQRTSDEDVDNVPEEQREKIRAIFFKIDKDGNGKIDCEEFYQFISSLGLEMPENEARLIFDTVKEKQDGKITVDGFYKYFLQTILDDSPGSAADSKLRAAFMAADRDNTGTVDFREFAEYLWEKRRSVRVSRLLDTFEKMDKTHKGQVTFAEFKEFALADPSVEMSLTDDVIPEQPEDVLRQVYEEQNNTEEVVDYLRNRWERFVSFRRPGASGNLVKYGKHGLIADVLPGDYNLVDLAAFSDLPPLVPKHAEVRIIQWESPTERGKLGRVVFPEDFDGVIPVDIATSDLLAYYGCSLANSTAINVSLLYRSAIQDFTYENQYIEDYVANPEKQGGAGLEHHPFSHLDMPLDDAGGYFVIGKMVEENLLHLTAFRVPTRHCLYIPGGTIHTNDYLTGTWRTMLSDEAPVNQGYIMRKTGPKDTDIKKFVFKFKEN